METILVVLVVLACCFFIVGLAIVLLGFVLLGTLFEIIVKEEL